MRMKLYNFLVNKHSGIRQTYHRLHDNADGAEKIKSYAALLSMNARYYLLGKKDFDMPADVKVYEDKPLRALSESAAHINKNELSENRMINELSGFDIISFDVFDTLILRPFSEPADVFFFLGEKTGLMDFKRVRMQQEYLARKEHEKKYGDNEVTFKEIWKRMERETGVSAKSGMRAELETEERFCFANPFMLKVFNALKDQGKTIIAVSDMYLPSGFVSRILKKNGFEGINKIYMSCEYGKSKSLGDIYSQVKDDFKGMSIVHVGDNEHSDVKKAAEAGLAACIYPNVNVSGRGARSYDISPVTGGAYRGVVNTAIYSGLRKQPPEYEYGYIYGGIFVLGYCAFIRNYCKKNSVDKLLFLSRDGDILKRAYDYLYPEDYTEYTYISRAVVTKLMRGHNRYDYLRRFVDYKVNRGISIGEVLEGMGLKEIKKKLGRGKKDHGFSVDAPLTNGNIAGLKSYLLSHFPDIDAEYSDMDEAAERYYSSLLSGVKKAAVVDIGWAGSAAVSLSILAGKDWGLKTEIIGLVAGTNTLHNSEPDSAEEFLASGRLVPYVFSQALNRDIMKKHDPNKNYNVYWELLLSSPTRQFTGFSLSGGSECPAGKSVDGDDPCIRRYKDIYLLFGDHDANTKGIKLIQKGIMDFVRDYHHHFKDFPYMFNISGRDAAAPMLLASGHDERYLKAIAGRFNLKIDVS